MKIIMIIMMTELMDSPEIQACKLSVKTFICYPPLLSVDA